MKIKQQKKQHSKNKLMKAHQQQHKIYRFNDYSLKYFYNRIKNINVILYQTKLDALVRQNIMSYI